VRSGSTAARPSDNGALTPEGSALAAGRSHSGALATSDRNSTVLLHGGGGRSSGAEPVGPVPPPLDGGALTREGSVWGIDVP